MMRKLLDPQQGFYGETGGALGAKINADRETLRRLYRGVKDRETRIRGTRFVRVDCRDAEIAADFNAYSITVVNLLKQVWCLSHPNEDPTGAEKYINSIPWMNPVLRWRNKVAAHPAAIDPRKKGETPTDRDISLMPVPVGVEEGRYVAPVLTPTRRDRSARDNRLTLPKWSLTQNWEQLLGRLPWLDDDGFFKTGQPLGKGSELWGRYPAGVTPDNVVHALDAEIPRGASGTIIMGAREDGSGGLRVKIKRNDDGTLSLAAEMQGKALPPSWVREGSVALPDGTIVVEPRRRK